MRRIGLCAGAAVVALAGCGTSSGDENGDAEASVPSTSSATSTAADVSASETLTGTASCSDEKGDADEADLTSVKLSGSSGGLTVTYKLAEPLDTSTGTTLLSLTAWDESGNVGRQLGVKWVDGTPATFTFDPVSAQQENLTATPEIDGKAVSITFPAETVTPLGRSWRWSAGTSIDGTDEDTCPEPGGDVLNPERQLFPG